MMQTSESYNQKNSLFNAMNRFIGAVNNMDQTVMVPSLLRDVPLDAAASNGAPSGDAGIDGDANDGDATYLHQEGDMYSSYVLLKSIRNDIEWGVLQGDEQRAGKAGSTAAAAAVAEDDLEKEFHFHLNGLHAVLSKLTRKADTLTSRYKEEVGCRR